MTYGFKNDPTLPKSSSDGLIATALDGVVYTENNRLHVKGNTAHYVYKFDGSPVGWYARNIKTCDDIYLGVGASPTVELENIVIKNTNVWSAIKQEQPEETEKE